MIAVNSFKRDICGPNVFVCYEFGIVCVFQARDLCVSDTFSKSSDPYICVNLGNQPEQRTSVVKKKYVYWCVIGDVI